MSPDYLWLTGALQLLTLFVVGPVIAIVIAYAAWRGKPQSFTSQRYRMLCVASGVTASVLLVLAKWINADVRTPQYFLQLACVLLGGPLLGVGIGGPSSRYFYMCGVGTRQHDSPITIRQKDDCRKIAVTLKTPQ